MISAKARTANGALTNGTTYSKCLDFFSLAGSARNMSETDLVLLFNQAYSEDAEVALRILLWLRDVRGGAGERRAFRVIVKTLKEEPEVMLSILQKTVEVGRWDDLFSFLGMSKDVDGMVFLMIAQGLAAGNALCAKWMPREKSNKPLARRLAKEYNMTNKEYRKLISSLSDTVEQKMCRKDWGSIDFSHVPSKAFNKYRSAFTKQAAVRFAKFLDRVEQGQAKVNAAAIFPHDIAAKYVYQSIPSDIARADSAQWAALPNYLEGTLENILPVIDVSDSMRKSVSGGGTTCMQVAISLGMYLAERTRGQFKDKFLTFSESPEVQTIQGIDLQSRVDSIRKSDWGFSTELVGSFKELLKAAKEANVPPENMPTTILILSDMEFNEGVNVRVYPLNQIRQQYKAAGYKLPKIVFWNLSGRAGNYPAQSLDLNVALVSGFSPSIMTAVLGGEDFTPIGVMLKAVMSDRYKIV